MGTKQELEDGRIDMPDLVVSRKTNVPPARIYETLADLSTHTTWAGSMHGKKHFGLRSLDAPVGAATVGTEFQSTGADPLGTFTDRSVVTEAMSASVFEFVTEGHLERSKRGKPANDTRITNRFEIAPTPSGSNLTYRGHETKWTNAPAPFRARVLLSVVRVVMKSDAKRTLRNLAAFASDENIHG